MTYSRRTRELAAQLCSMAACSDLLLISVGYLNGLRRGHPARKLAMAALLWTVIHKPGMRLKYAEAEALIRTGWSP